MSQRVRGYLDPEQEARFDIWWSTVVVPNLERSRTMAIARLRSLQFDEDWLRQAREKAREGRVEHGGDIEYMTAGQLQREIWDEDADGLILGAHFHSKLD